MRRVPVRSLPLRARHARHAVAVLAIIVLPSWALAAYDWNLPAGLPVPKVPADNPMSVEKAELGRFLFHDRRLSGNLTQSCGTCHRQARGFASNRARVHGSTGEPLLRTPMALGNAVYGSTLTWANPNVRSIEQVVDPTLFGTDPVELGMGGREAELVERLRDDRHYPQLFRAAFPDDAEPISPLNVVRAIATFVRTLVTGSAPYDLFVNGIDRSAMSASAIRGGRLFFSERLECFHCHGGFNFTESVTHSGKPIDEIAFLNNALYNVDGRGAYPAADQGLAAITGRPADMGRFKPVTLRNVAVSAPYMHDGSIATLAEVIDHYAAGGRTITDGPNAGVGSASPIKSEFMTGFRITAEEKADLVAFLESLTDEAFLTNPQLSDPFADDACRGDCDGDGSVTVDDLIYAVNVALGSAPLTACMSLDGNADGMVDVAELVTAVTVTLAGCG